MATNKELTDQIKKLKSIIREMKKELEANVVKEDNLPKTTMVMVNENDVFYTYTLKFNPETKAVMIKDKKKFKTTDKALAMGHAKKLMICEIMNKKLESL